MAGWVYRMLQLSTVAACSVAAFVAVVTTSGAGEPTRERGGGSVRVLQMNLCDSGHAHCYTGRSVAEAGEVIRAEVPDVVTVNEVCQDASPSARRTCPAEARRLPVPSAPTCSARRSRRFVPGPDRHR
jgi:hypothetical protein